MKIYLDNCCFNRPYDDQTQLKIALESRAKMFIQSLVLENKIELIWSYILKLENSDNPYNEKRNAIGKWKYLSTEFIEENENIILFAEDVVMKNGIKAKDALHISCAVFAKCDYFITVDKRILNFHTDKIKIVDPIGFLKDWSEGK
jgi:predicted nucleic acid-binding protein